MEQRIHSDLGCSSKYSNECITLVLPSKGDKALKTVVEKASLSSAIEQGLVDPKQGAYELIKHIGFTLRRISAKGKRANIHVHCDGCIY